MPLVTEQSLSAGSSRITAAALGSTSLIGPGLQAAGPPSQMLFIEANFNNAFTGEGVSFKAYNIGGLDNDGFDADFEWSFDDPGAIYENHGENVPLPNDRNRALGPIVGHTWLTPGVKTVTCTQRTAGGTATATFQVTVTEPTVDAFAEVLYISYAGNFVGAPPEGGKVRYVTNPDQLYTGAMAGPWRNNSWLRFRRGETFDLQTTAKDRTGGPSLNTGPHLWDAWGEGPKPVLTVSRATASGVGVTGSLIDGMRPWFNRLVWRDLSIQGGYDPFLNPENTVKGGWDTSQQRLIRLFFTLGDANNMRVSLWRCDVDGIGFVGEVRSPNAHLYYGDMKITNWRDYGIANFGLCRTLFIDGGIIQQAEGVQSMDGHGGGDITDPDHGCLRMTPGEAWTGLYSNQMRVRGGWFPNRSDGRRTEQPCVRFANRGADLDFTGMRVSAVGCSFDGGSTVMTWSTDNGNELVRSIGRFLVDMCRFRGTAWTIEFISAQFGGITVRNSMGVMPDVGPGLLASFTRFLNINPRRNDYPIEVIGAPIVLRNNTLVSEQSLANNSSALNLFGVGTENGPHSPNVLDADNLLVGPFRPNSLPDWSPLDAEYAPLPGSAAIGAAGSGAPLRDLLGRLRSSPPSVGALDKTS